MMNFIFSDTHKHIKVLFREISPLSVPTVQSGSLSCWSLSQLRQAFWMWGEGANHHTTLQLSVTNILYIRILKKEIPSCMKALWCPSVNPWTPASLAPHNYLQNDGCCGVSCTRWQEFARLLWVWKLFWLLSMGEIYLLNTALRAVLLSQ